jgi:hypothetical protein
MGVNAVSRTEKVTTDSLRAWIVLASEKQGDIWTFVGVNPDTGFVHTVHSSARNLEEAKVFVGKIKEKSNGVAPVFIG